MKDYLLLMRGGKPASAKSEEESKAEMQAWGTYMGGLGQKGVLVAGLPLVSGGKTLYTNEVKSEAVNSPKEGIVGGYLIVKADNLEHATELAKDCPHLSYEGNIEVREIGAMPEM